MSTAIEQARQYCRDRRNEHLETLKELVALPSISTDPASSAKVRETAAWLVERLEAMGFTGARAVPTAGQPVVVGELTGPAGAPVVLLYGHYDVQPVDPLDLWQSDPFVAEVRGDYLHGRGTTDMKGQLLTALHGLEAACSVGAPPVTIRCVFEGEEEVGSPHFADFIRHNPGLVEADFCLNPDCGMLAPDTPTITYSLRGLAYFEIHVSGPAKDLHSGVYGGTVRNPAEALARALGGLHDESGRITLPGFYDAVRAMDPEERSELARLPRSAEGYLEQTGVPRLWGEAGYTPVEQAGGRPALDINGLLSGFTGGGSKTVLPAKAMAKLSARLVADQEPEAVRQQLADYLTKVMPDTVRWELEMHAGAYPAITNRKLPAVARFAGSLEAIWGCKPVFARGGGTIGVVGDLQRMVGLESLLVGFSLPGDDMHSPNERLHLPTWHLGTEAMAHFFLSLGA